MKSLIKTGRVIAFSGMAMLFIPGPNSTASSSSNIMPSATKLAFTGPVVGNFVGTWLSPVITVALQDSQGGAVAQSGVPITIAMTSGTGTLSGTKVRSTNSSGQVVFYDLSFDQPGDKILTATSPGLASAVSNTFNIMALLPTALGFVQQPTDAPVNIPIAPPITVQLLDSNNGAVAKSGVSITLALSSGTGTLSGTTTQPTDATGLATFNDIRIDTAGVKALKASSAIQNPGTSNSFTIHTPTDVAIAMASTPAFFRAGSSGSYSITVRNAGSNGITQTITVTDTLPTGLLFSSITGSGWTCNTSGQTVTCTNPGPLAAGSSSTLVLAVIVDANSPSGVTQTATVATPGDGHPDDDTATLFTYIQSPSIASPLNNPGSQLLYFYEDNATTGARGTYSALLTMTNTHLWAAVNLHFQFYLYSASNFQAALEFVDTLKPGQRIILDPQAIRQPSNNAIVGTATGGRYLLTVTAVNPPGTSGTELRAIPFNWLAGTIEVRENSSGNTWMTNAISRQAVDRGGDAMDIDYTTTAQSRLFINGVDRFFQRFQPQLLSANYFYPPSSVKTGVPFGNRMSIVAFQDYFGSDTDTLYRIQPATVTLNSFLFDNASNAYSVPLRTITCLGDYVVGNSTAGNLPDFLNFALYPAIVDTGGWLRMRPSALPANTNLLGWFSQTPGAGAFGEGDLLIGTGTFVSTGSPQNAPTQGVLSPILNAPTSAQMGGQLIYFYEDGTTANRGTWKSYLAVTNMNISTAVTIHVQFYNAAFAEYRDFFDTLAGGKTFVIDPAAIKRPSDLSLVGAATDGRYVVTVTPVHDAYSSDLRPMAFNWLSGQMWIVDLARSAAWMTNAATRLAVDSRGVPLANGQAMDGSTGFFQKIQPNLLQLPSLYRTGGAGAVNSGVPFGNRMSFLSFKDHYTQPVGTSGYYRIEPVGVSLYPYAFDASGNAYSTPPRSLNGLTEFTVAPATAHAAGDFPDFLVGTITPVMATAGGWLRMRPLNPPQEANILGWFGQSLGRYGSMDYLVGLTSHQYLPASAILVSINTDGVQGNAASTLPSISADGRYVAFSSTANNLVPGDTNNRVDVFVRDRVTEATERVSVGAGGEQDGSGPVDQPAISGDGRFVAFVSNAGNLVPGDTNGFQDVFVRDRVAGTTEWISVGTGGAPGNGGSYHPSISSDGRYVAFESDASNLVAGDTNNANDIFVRDRAAGTTERISVGAGGVQANNFSNNPSLSSDGRYVAFQSYAGNLVTDDTNNAYDIFVRDRVAGTTERVSLGAAGVQGNNYSINPSISGDGRYVAFVSNASNLVAGDTNAATDIFVRSRVAGTMERVSVASGGGQGNGNSYRPSISGDGRYVAFVSHASNLVVSDTNNEGEIFVRDRIADRTMRLSLASGGVQANSGSYNPSISADGSAVAFDSLATNLMANDTNHASDIFVSLIAQVVPQLLVSSIAPRQGYNDIPNEVVIRGQAFQDTTTAIVGGVPLAKLGWIDSRTLQGVVPAGLAPGAQEVVVQDSSLGQSATLYGGYTVQSSSSTDLFISMNDIWTSPVTVLADHDHTLGVTIHRQGGVGNVQPLVQFFQGDPDSGGIKLGEASSTVIPDLAGSLGTASIQWRPSGMKGTAVGQRKPDAPGATAVVQQVDVYVRIDPYNAITETSETNNQAYRTVTVRLTTNSLSDITPPQVTGLVINSGSASTTSSAITLNVSATDNSGSANLRMRIVEQEFNSSGREWVAVQDSGWVPFQSAYPWDLTARGGVRYFQVWVADAADNVSLTPGSARINYLPSTNAILLGQTRIYRVSLAVGQALTATLTVTSGDADLYIWPPGGGLALVSNLPGTATDTLSLTAAVAGDYQIEVYGYLESTYGLALTGVASVQEGAQPGRRLSSSKPVPGSPIVPVGNKPPEQQAVPDLSPLNTQILYLPVIYK